MQHLLKSTIPIILLLFTLQAKSQNALHNKIQNAHNTGVQFEQVTLFNTTTGDAHESVVKNAVLLKEDNLAVLSLYERKPKAVSLTFTTVGKTYTIEMLQSHPFEDNAEVGYIDYNGRHRCGFDAGLHYQGAVSGSERSVAAMSVFANGDVMILFANDDGNFNIGKLEDGSDNYIFYNDKNMYAKSPFMCHVIDTKPQKAMNDMARTTGVEMCNKVRTYWECDYDMYTLKGSLSATQSYLSGLFNQEQALYANEEVAVELSSLYIWTTPDSYNSSIGSNEVFVFMAYWNGRGNSFNGDVAMLITHDGGGGIAGLNGMYNRPYAYGYSGLTGTYSTLPTYSWDVTTPTHEMGHQCGLYHTHNCVWHTGAGGTCGAIDNCYTIESASGCSTCGSTDSVAKGGFQGTIMSYCHLTSIGVNLALGFGPLPGNALRNNVNTNAALSSVIGIKLSPTNICSNDGAVTLSFTTDNFGTAPYTYYWSGGKTTQNISGLSLPGNYSVIVTDSNKCTTTLNVNITKFATPGNGKGPNFQPICCKDTSFTYTLTASVPANLVGCQTVAWLRTSSALTSYSAAQTAFNSAAPADIMYSTNSDSINTTTPAKLDVPSPTPCITQSYYYTPFISKKARAVVTLTDSNITTGSVSTNSTQIGNYTSLADNTSLINICDANDTATVNSLIVTVSGYTGRASFMTISVQSSSGNELYSLNSLAGNGVYIIPIKNSDNLLQYLKISAYDLNYKKADTVIASSLTVKATRNVTYPAIARPDFGTVCNTGSSAQLSFGPTACVKLNAANIEPINNSLLVYPNPGSDHVTLEFTSHTNGNGVLMITDMVGRIVQSIPVVYIVGDNKMDVDVHLYTNGIYFLSFTGEDGIVDKVKLTIAK